MLKSMFKYKTHLLLIAFILMLISGSLILSKNFNPDEGMSEEGVSEFPLPQYFSLRYFTGRKHLNSYVATLKKYMLSEKNAGIYVADLGGDVIFSKLNSDKFFNPASIIKFMTTSMALNKWGPDFNFTSSVLIEKSQTKQSSIKKVYIDSDGDPLLRSRDLQMAFNQIRSAGIKRITNALIINPLVKVNAIHNDRDTKYILNKLMRRAGLRFQGKIIIKNFNPDSLTVLVQRKSPDLIKILYEMNAHSINPLAERLGEALGGPSALENYLLSLTAYDSASFEIASCSGLGENRFTPRQVVEILSKIKFRLDSLDIPIQMILPSMGLDGSTLGNRLREMKYRGTIVAKTGTLIATDDGVSSLAGFINTLDYGILPFCIMNKNGEVSFFIKQQNYFLRLFLNELNSNLEKFEQINPRKYWIYAAKKWEKPKQDNNDITMDLPVLKSD